MNGLQEEIKRAKQLMGIQEGLMSNLIGNKCNYETLSKAVKEFTQKRYGHLKPQFEEVTHKDGEKAIIITLGWMNSNYTKDPQREVRNTCNSIINEYKYEFNDFCEKGLKGKFGLHKSWVHIDGLCEMVRLENVEDSNSEWERKKYVVVRYTDHGKEILNNELPEVREFISKFKGKEKWFSQIYVGMRPLK